MKIQVRYMLFAAVCLFALSACEKSREGLVPIDHPANSAEFIMYTIPVGLQYCDQNIFKQTNYNELKFIVKFDSSAIYQTTSPDNQLDVNKLYGFSDNNDQHQNFSARFGWRWSNGALRLFGYTYNNSIMSFEELGVIPIGTENSCSIKVTATNYIFTLNEGSKSMPRASTTVTAVGYKLYPYFGGNEPTSHTIHIWIKEL